jgi:hypothetical protein
MDNNLAPCFAGATQGRNEQNLRKIAGRTPMLRFNFKAFASLALHEG